MERLYEQYKGLLYKLAYQLTGSIADAEDAVHDVFVKLHTVDPDRLTHPQAYLCKMVTNRCLDLLKSAYKKREQYYGQWLPEPVLTDAAADVSDTVIQGELLSYARPSAGRCPNRHLLACRRYRARLRWWWQSDGGCPSDHFGSACRSLSARFGSRRATI